MCTHLCSLTSPFGLLEELAVSTEPVSDSGEHGTAHSLPSISLLPSGDGAASLLGCCFGSSVSCQDTCALNPFLESCG